MVKEVPQDDSKNQNIDSGTTDDLPFDATGFTPTELKAIVSLSEVPSKFKNQTELCENLGISRKTLYRWQQRKDFKEAFSKMSKWMFLHTGHIARTGLLKSCAKGNPQSIKLYFQYAEGWSEKTIHEHEGNVAIPTNVQVLMPDGSEIKSLLDLTNNDQDPKKGSSPLGSDRTESP